MQTRIKWMGNAAFEAENSLGHKITMDGPPEHGGLNQGFRPMEMLLIGLGGCAGFYLIHILKKMRVEINNCTVQVDAKRDDDPPGLFQHIHVHYKISGKHLNDKKIKRAIKLSEEIFCSASITLSISTTITHSITLINVEH